MTKQVRGHNRKATYRKLKTKNGSTRSVYVKGGSVKTHRRKAK